MNMWMALVIYFSVSVFVLGTFCSRTRWFRAIQHRLGIRSRLDRSSRIILGSWFLLWTLYLMSASLGWFLLGEPWDSLTGFALVHGLPVVLLVVGGGLYWKGFIGLLVAAYTILMLRPLLIWSGIVGPKKFDGETLAWLCQFLGGIMCVLPIAFWAGGLLLTLADKFQGRSESESPQ